MTAAAQIQFYPPVSHAPFRARRALRLAEAVRRGMHAGALVVLAHAAGLLDAVFSEPVRQATAWLAQALCAEAQAWELALRAAVAVCGG